MVSLVRNAFYGLFLPLLAAAYPVDASSSALATGESGFPEFGGFFEEGTVTSESTVTEDVTETVSSTVTAGTSTHTIYEGSAVTRTVTDASTTTTVYKDSITETVTHTYYRPAKGYVKYITEDGRDPHEKHRHHYESDSERTD